MRYGYAGSRMAAVLFVAVWTAHTMWSKWLMGETHRWVGAMHRAVGGPGSSMPLMIVSRLGLSATVSITDRWPSIWSTAYARLPSALSTTPVDQLRPTSSVPMTVLHESLVGAVSRIDSEPSS